MLMCGCLRSLIVLATVEERSLLVLSPPSLRSGPIAFVANLLS